MSEIHGFQVELDKPFDLDVTVDCWVFPDVQPTPEQKKPGEFARCISLNNQLIPVRVSTSQPNIHPIALVIAPWFIANWAGHCT